ncbi:MAG TPA: diguanylate cyclase [Kofleriaceae bacterium]|nr:diguanylate cyclase [Kofleriaceae bacterium]
MSRAKPRRAGTRSGKRAESLITDAMPIKKPELPPDLADAAEAALDDLLNPDRSASFAIDVEGDFEVATDPARDVPASAKAKPPAPPPKSHARRPKTLPPPPPPADDAILEVQQLPVIPHLRFAIYEQADQLASAQGAIVAAGHVVVAGASGTANLSKIADHIVGGIDAILVALPGGEPVIDIALAQEPRRPIVIAAVTGKASDGCTRAIAAGADLVTSRPHDLERMSPVLLAAARLHTERRLAQNARGAEAMLRAKLEEISDPDPRGLQPIEVFQRVIELELKRARRFEYPLSVALFAVDVPPPPPPAGIRGILRARAGNALIHTIRDIDIATQLDQERFLVLLPYTDLAGAAGLGRRVVAAVAEGDPVISAGRSFPPRVVGAVAGARPGQELSFAKLMKDATQALAQARKDGAELAVQP